MDFQINRPWRAWDRIKTIPLETTLNKPNRKLIAFSSDYYLVMLSTAVQGGSDGAPGRNGKDQRSQLKFALKKFVAVGR